MASPRREDRWQARGGLRPSAFAAGLLAVSLAVHGAILAFVLFGTRAEAIAPAEIPVEIVEEMPSSSPGGIAGSPATEPNATKAPDPAEAERARLAEELAALEAEQAALRDEPPAKPPAPHPRPEPQTQASVSQRMEQLIGPMSAMAMPTMAADGGSALDDAAPYRQLVMSQVAKQKREGRQRGVPGEVTVAFTIGDAGEVLSCEVREKSVDPALDAEAVAMVRRGAPYPPPPAGGQRSFSFGLRFSAF